MTGFAEARAALERGKSVVLVCAPAPDHAPGVWEVAGPAPSAQPAGPATVIACTDAAAATEWVATAPRDRRVHAVTGVARAARLVGEGAVEVIAGATTDLTELVARSALKLDSVTTLVIAWPEALHADHAASLDGLLGEARDAGRLILTWNPALLGDFLERHAYRAPVIGTRPVGEDGRPLGAVARARYALVAPERRLSALREALDALDPARPFIWTSDGDQAEQVAALLGASAGAVVGAAPPGPGERFDAVICARLPAREQFAALARLAVPVLLVAPYQLPYVRWLADPLEPLSLSTASERARDRAAALRARVAEIIGHGDVSGELHVLAPLFERFDPAEVAAAVLAISHQATTPSPASPLTAAPRWVKVFVNVGKKDRAAAKDLVGALIKEVGVAKEQIGRIEMRETFSLVEIAVDHVDRVVRGLQGVSIKGRRAAARVERP